MLFEPLIRRCLSFVLLIYYFNSVLVLSPLGTVGPGDIPDSVVNQSSTEDTGQDLHISPTLSLNSFHSHEQLILTIHSHCIHLANQISPLSLYTTLTTPPNTCLGLTLRLES
jgi:hypothetical protein